MSSIKYHSILKYSLFLIILLPLVFTPFTFFPWHFGKTMIFQMIVEILVFLFLAYSLFCHSERRPFKTTEVEESLKIRNHLNCLDLSILLFLAIITFAAFTGTNPVNSFWGNQARANGVFTWLHFGAFYFLLVWLFKKKDCCDRIYAFTAIISIAVVVAVLASLTSLFPQILPDSWLATSGGGIIGNRAFLASYLILALCLSLYLFVSSTNKLRWLFLVASVLFIYTIVNTGNRGALLGIIIGVFFCLALCLFLIRNKKVKIWSAIFMVAVCSLLITLFLSRQSLFWQNHFSPLSGLANISLSSGTAQTRLLAWQSAWQGIKERPFFGWGWGNYEIVFNKYYNPQFLQSGFAETVWDKPHNWLLEIGVTSGIFGIISYVSILFFAGFYLFKKQPIGASLKSVTVAGRIILSVAILAYFIADLFLFETTNGLILWFVILAFISSQFPAIAADKTIGKKDIFSGVLKNILFVILIFSIYRFNFIPLYSSYFMRQAELASNIKDWSAAAQKTLSIKGPFFSENAIFLAEQLVRFDKAGAVSSKDTKAEDTILLVANALDNESKKLADNLSFPVWAGQAYLVLGEKIDEKFYVEAERSLSRALEIAPQKQEVLFLLVRLYLLKRDFPKAINFAQKAIEAAPGIGTSHWFFGLANVASNNRAQGLKSIEKAIELGYSLTADQKLYILDLYALEKNYPKLIGEYKKMIEDSTENINWLIKLAVVYAESGDKKSALETTRYAVGLFPPLKTEAEKFIKQYKLLEK